VRERWDKFENYAAYDAFTQEWLSACRRVLKPTGSLYLHCDPTASHYLKIVMDAVFGKEKFRNEIIWHYSGWNKKLLASFESRSDIILFYGKGKAGEQKFNSWARPWKSEEEYLKIRKQKVRVDEYGRKYVLSDAGGGKRVPRYLDEAMKTGVYIDNVWDIDKLNNSSKERLGYPTQKPEALLERIIKSSSDEGDLVLDPFCGCGTTITVAERFNRRWIGIDITHLAIALIKARLEDSFGPTCSPYIVRGEPTVLEEARALKEEDPYQFQFWALGLVKAHPLEGKKKGADRGIDGVLYFVDDDSGNPKKILIQVKGGHVNAAQIRDLRGTIEREGAVIGAFITLEPSTKPMRTEALEAGLYIPEHFPDLQVPRLQILTVEGLLNGTEQLEYPRVAPEVTFKRAEKKTKLNKVNQKQMF